MLSEVHENLLDLVFVELANGVVVAVLAVLLFEEGVTQFQILELGDEDVVAFVLNFDVILEPLYLELHVSHLVDA